MNAIYTVPFYKGKHLSILFLSLGLVLFECRASAQVKLGANPTAINKTSLLELESPNQGLRLTRVDTSAINDLMESLSPSQQELTNGMIVYQLKDKSLYYRSGDWWKKIIDDKNVNGLGLEPWFVQETTDQAAENTDHIYQMGSVAIGKEATTVGSNDVRALLDVAGPIRGANASENVEVGNASFAFGQEAMAIGDNSFAFGNSSTGVGGTGSTEARGVQSFAFGNGAKALVTRSFAFGHETKAEGINSLAFGFRTKAEADNSFAFGNYSQTSGIYSKAIGFNLQAHNRSELVVGEYNAITTGNKSTLTENNPLFQIGNGRSGTGNRNNAFTVLVNGYTGIGLRGEEEEAKPKEMLDIEGFIDPLLVPSTFDQEDLNKVRIRDLSYTEGNPSDRIVVVDDRGILRSIVNDFSSSDIRYKKDLEELQNILPLLDSLNAYFYSFRTEEFREKNFSMQRQIGLVAQEVEEYFPELIYTDKQGFKSLNYPHFTAILLEAVKELRQGNLLLERQLLKLGKKVMAVEHELSTLKEDFEDR